MRRGIMLAIACLAWAVGPARGDDYLSEGVLTRAGLTRVWQAQVDVDPSRGTVVSVIRHKDMLMAMTDMAVIHAFNAENGRTLWSRRVGNPRYPSMSPAANDKYVAVINGLQLFIINRSDGSPVWEHTLDGSPGAGAALSDTHVFIPMINGRLDAYELALKEGVVKPPWFYKSDGRALVRPLVTPQTLSWTTDSGFLYISPLDPLGVKYRLKTHDKIEARPAYWTPNVYVCSLDGFVYAVNERTGETVWTFNAGDPISVAPVAINGVVYVVTGLGSFYALDGEGQEIWHANGARQFVATSPSRVYVAERHGGIAILDAKTGARKGSLPVGDAKMLVNHDTDRIYFSSKTGVLRCLREIELTEPLSYAPPALADLIKQSAKESDAKKKPAKEEKEDAAPPADDAVPDPDTQ